MLFSLEADVIEARCAETPPEIAPTEATPVEAVRPVEPEAVILVETVETPPPPAEVDPPEQVVAAKPVVPPPPRRKPNPPEPEIAETLPAPAPPEAVMDALFLKDLADKTRRGLRGRVVHWIESPSAAAE